MTNPSLVQLTVRLLAVVGTTMGAAHAVSPKLTTNCNTRPSSDLIVWTATDAQAQHVLATVATPALDPGLYDALWQPQAGKLYPLASYPYPGLGYPVQLTFDPFQDLAEIHDAVMDDPHARGAGIGSDEIVEASACFATLPGAGYVTVTEYQNTILDHYFLSSSSQENASIDAGGAGPGWRRTGQVFRTITIDSCRGTRQVFRFYSPNAHSHFFTVDAGECGFVRNHDANWVGEGVAFGAVPAVAGACPAGYTTPLYRVYNRREAFNDQNHRFTTDPAIYQQMIDKGWAGEGTVMCLWN